MNQEILKKIFEYRNGNLIRKTKSTGVKIGSIAGTLHHSGYVQISIKGKKYSVHRLVFLYHHGYLPKEVDHIDGNRANNNIENLRAASVEENRHNSKLSKSNTSGIKGVSWNKASKKWVVRLMTNKKLKYFGSYFDIDYAKFVSEAMRNKYHKNFANNG